MCLRRTTVIAEREQARIEWRGLGAGLSIDGVQDRNQRRIDGAQKVVSANEVYDSYGRHVAICLVRIAGNDRTIGLEYSRPIVDEYSAALGRAVCRGIIGQCAEIQSQATCAADTNTAATCGAGRGVARDGAIGER